MALQKAKVWLRRVETKIAETMAELETCLTIIQCLKTSIEDDEKIITIMQERKKKLEEELSQT